MPFYRMNMNMKVGSEIYWNNTIHELAMDEKTIKKLVELGRISPVKGPPLAVLEGWESRAERLAKIGVITVEDFLNASYEQLSSVWKTKETVDKYKDELVMQHLIVKTDKEGCGC